MDIFTTFELSLFTLLIGMFLVAVVGYLIGFFLRKLISQYQVKEAEEKRRKIIEEADVEAKNLLKSAAVEVKEQSLAAKLQMEKSYKGNGRKCGRRNRLRVRKRTN